MVIRTFTFVTTDLSIESRQHRLTGVIATTNITCQMHDGSLRSKSSPENYFLVPL